MKTGAPKDSRSNLRLDITRTLFAVALTSKGFFSTALFARFEVEGVTLDLLNNVLLLDLALKTA